MSAATTFAERFAYARWLKHFWTGEAPGNAEIGRAVGRTGQAVGAWEQSDEPPRDFRVHQPLAACLGIDQSWLVFGRGAPPRPDLWEPWIAQRREAAAGKSDPFAGPPGDMGIPSAPGGDFSADERKRDRRRRRG